MMKTISDDYGIVVLADREADLSFDLGEEISWRKPLEQAAKAGQVFFIDREDPTLNLKAELVTEPVTEETHRRFIEQVGGSYLLWASSGKLRLTGLGEWLSGLESDPVCEVEPGAYNVIVYSTEHADIELYKQDIADLIGKDDKRYVAHVDRLSFLGCLPTIVAIGVIVFAPWKVGVVAGVVAALLWLPHLIGLRTGRYRRVREKTDAYDAEMPLFVLQLSRVESTGGLVGGFHR